MPTPLSTPRPLLPPAPDSRPAAGERIIPANYGYGGKLECIGVIDRFELGFCRGNALKYLWRHRGKNGREDLVKALWYLQWGAARGLRFSEPLQRLRLSFCRATFVTEPFARPDSELLEAAATTEKRVFVEIVAGDAAETKRLVDQVVAEVYPAPAEGDELRWH